MCILSFNNAIWIIMNSCGSIGPTWASLNSELYTWRIWQSDKPIVWVSNIIQKMENYLECAIADWIEFMKPIGGKHIRQITVLSLGIILIICPCSSGSLPIFVALDRWPILYFLREVTTYNHLLCRMTTRADGRWSCWFAEFFALQFWHSSSPSFSRSLQENTVGFIIDRYLGFLFPSVGFDTITSVEIQFSRTPGVLNGYHRHVLDIFIVFQVSPSRDTFPIKIKIKQITPHY